MEEYERVYGLTRDFWWFRAKQALLKQAMEGLCNGSGNKILDVGCGVGAALEDAAAYGTVVGIDIARKSVKYCSQKHNSSIALADAASIPFKSSSFDFALCLDVIYHPQVKSDSAVLHEIHRVLKMQGKLVLLEPAFKSLKRARQDDANGRRYRIHGLMEMLEAHGFSVKKISYWNAILAPFIFLFRKAAHLNQGGRVAGHTEYRLKPPSKPLNWFLYRILLLENKAVRRFNLPFGTSIFCIAMKVQEQKTCQDGEA